MKQVYSLCKNPIPMDVLICDNCQFQVDCKIVEPVVEERLNEYLEDNK